MTKRSKAGPKQRNPREKNMVELDLFVKYATKNVRRQFNEDVEDLRTQTKELAGGDALVEAMLRLRTLYSEAQRYQVREILLGLSQTPSNEYWPVIDIMSPREYMRVPSALSSVLQAAFFDILDDGFLRLVRIEGNYYGGGKKFVLHRLVNREWTTRHEVEQKILEVIPMGDITNIKRSWFDSLYAFADFLNILGNPDLIESEEQLAYRLDELMKPEKTTEWNED